MSDRSVENDIASEGDILSLRAVRARTATQRLDCPSQHLDSLLLLPIGFVRINRGEIPGTKV